MQTLFSNEKPAAPAGFQIPYPTDFQELSGEQIWQQIKFRLKEQIDQKQYQTWIEPLKVKNSQSNEILISTPNLVFYQVVLDQYLNSIEQVKNELGINSICLRFEVEGESPLEELTQSSGYELETLPQPDEPSPSQEKPKQAGGFSQALSTKCRLNNAYTFDSFVKGPSNQFAHATCLAVAENPGKTYNPLFIYGTTGLGKTHLLHAVGSAVLKRNPNACITYISSERFMNEMIYCIRFNRMWDFRRKYRHNDVFLVDDIQFISGKDRTQEEFFHTFNTLYEAKKQIVITSDLFPQDIPDIEDRLRNRFQWGLIADIQPPDVEHRMAILMNKADHLGINLKEDVALYIATQAKRNVRELEGALHRIAAFATFHGRPLDIDLAYETFQNVLGEPPKRLTIETIQKIVAEHFKVRINDLKSKKRQRALTMPRQIAMYLSRIRTNSSFPEIGSRFGGKDHTTVMHAVRKIEKDVALDLDLKTHIEALERKLEQIY